MTEIEALCARVKQASKSLATLSNKTKNQILLAAAAEIAKHSKKIIAANQKDLALAKESKMEPAKLERLMLDEKRITALVVSLKSITKLPDPVGKITYDVKRKNGLHIRRITTPLGVLLAIYESRPNVTSDIAALALKSGNAVILKCGSESINSSKALAEFFTNALKKFNVDENAIRLVAGDREYTRALLQMENYIDVVIPRGSKSLVKAVLDHSRIPVFRHLDGNCHTYIHTKADFDKARKVLFNAKLRRVSVCGATESLLIDEKIAKQLLPLIVDDLVGAQCEVRGELAAVKIDSRIKLATDEDFYTEYLDKIISVKIVSGIDEAIEHIEKYGSSHTEAIITEDKAAARKFFALVNSAIVMHNASTQFADGGEFGLGAEVGIATGKLHARGPVGLEQLTTYKYIVDANYALRK